MGQVITFPKQPRSAVERTVRQAMQGANLGLSRELFDQVAESVSTAAETWNSFKVAFKDDELLELVPEITDEVRGLIDFAAKKGALELWKKALIERIVFERALALAGYRRG